jgi:hypothetical protein
MHAATFQGCATYRVNCFAAAMFFTSKMQAKSAFCHTFRVTCCLFTCVSVTFESAKCNAQCFEEALQHLQQQTRIANPKYSKQIELARNAAVEIFQHEMRGNSSSAINIHANTRLHLSRSEPVDLPAVSCRVLLKQHFAQDLEEMKGQYIWSVRWYGLIERVLLPKPTRPSLSRLHYTLRSPASTQASARTC